MLEGTSVPLSANEYQIDPQSQSLLWPLEQGTYHSGQRACLVKVIRGPIGVVMLLHCAYVIAKRVGVNQYLLESSDVTELTQAFT